MSSPIPSPAPTASPVFMDKAFDGFGYTLFNAPTRDSRHDRRLSAELLPSYAESEAMSPPQYSRKDEPTTLAMYLFKFGFFFPLFWIMGVFILCSPLRAPSLSEAAGDWLLEKTDVEKQLVIDRIRRAELKWARRCLYAILSLVLIALAAGMTAWALYRR